MLPSVYLMSIRSDSKLNSKSDAAVLTGAGMLLLLLFELIITVVDGPDVESVVLVPVQMSVDGRLVSAASGLKRCIPTLRKPLILLFCIFSFNLDISCESNIWNLLRE